MADLKVKNNLVVEGTQATVNGAQVTTTTNTQTLTNKSIDASSNTLTNIPDSALSSGIDASKIADGSISNSEFQQLNNLSSPAVGTTQAQTLTTKTIVVANNTITTAASGNLAATELNAALAELQGDIDSRALDSTVIKKDGSVTFTANQPMGGFKLTGLGAPSSANDSATKGYVDNVAEGLKPKQAVRLATVGDITLSGNQNIDGPSTSTGDRVLVKDQAAPEENGIYIAAAGAWSRSTDFDSLSPIDEINGSLVAVQEGSSNAGKIFIQYGTVTTLGTDPINFTFYNSIALLSQGVGIEITGAQIALADTAVTPGTYGSSSQVSQITIDQQGRITSASDVTISAAGLTGFDEAAQDAVGGMILDTATIDLVYNDATPSLSANIVNNSIGNTQLGTGLDASKIGDGSVSTTEFQYLSTVTSNIQDQLDSKIAGVVGDIYPTSFSLTNNQAAAANVTGLAFANASIKSFKALVDVRIDATSDLFEVFELTGIQKASSWDMSQVSTGDNSGVVFSITTAGQIQYTSTNNAGFVSAAAKFRASVIPV